MPAKYRNYTIYLLLVPVCAFMLAFFVLPLCIVAFESFKTKGVAWTLTNYATIFGQSYYWHALWNTFYLSFLSTVITFIIGYPLAYYMMIVEKNVAIRRLFYILTVIPLFTSNIVRSFGWVVLLGRQGLTNEFLMFIGIIETPLPLLYTTTSIVIGLSYVMLPFMVLSVASVLKAIDPALTSAARDLGANGWTAFQKIVFPLSLPGVVAGSLIVFTLSVSAYVTPSVMSGGKTMVMSMLIYSEYATIFNFGMGAALAMVLLVSTLMIVTGYRFMLEGRSSAGAVAR